MERSEYTQIQVATQSAIWLSRMPHRTWDDTFNTLERWLMPLDLNVQFAFETNWKTAREIFTLMAKKPQNQNERAKWRGFVNINLDSEDWKAFDHWIASKGYNRSERTQALLEAGHQLSVKWDERSLAFLVAMRCDVKGHVNGGLCITSRSRDLSDAIDICLWKHFEYCDGDWAQYFTNSPSGPVRG